MKRFKHFSAVAVAALVVFAGMGSRVLGQEKLPVEALLPKDAWLVVIAEDGPGLRKALETHPVARFWEDDQVKRFFAPLRKAIEEEAIPGIKREWGMEPSEALDAFVGGGGGLALTGLPKEPGGKLEAVLVWRLGNFEKVNGVFNKHKEERTRQTASLQHRTEDYQGISIQTLEDRDDRQAVREAWALSEQYGILGNDTATIKRAIDRIQGRGGNDTLERSQQFAADRRRIGKTHVLAWLNARRLVDLLMEMVDANPEANDPQLNAFIPGGIKGALTALGIDKLGGVYVSLLIGERQTEFQMGLTHEPGAALMDLFTYGSGPVEKPKFIPAKVLSASAAKFNLGSFVNQLLGLVGKVSPFAGGLIQAQLQNFSGRTGVDLQRDLLNNIGDDLVSADFLKELDPNAARNEEEALEQVSGLASSFLAVSLKDRQGFETALNRLLAAVAPQGEMFEKKEFLGNTVYTMSQPVEEGMVIAYCFVDKWLLFSMGAPGQIEAALIANSRPGQSLWDRTDVQASLRHAPADTSSLTWGDTGGLGATITTLFQMMAQFDGGDLNEVIDMKAAPKREVWNKYFGHIVGWGDKNREGLFSKMILLHSKQTLN